MAGAFQRPGPCTVLCRGTQPQGLPPLFDPPQSGVARLPEVVLVRVLAVCPRITDSIPTNGTQFAP